MSELLEAFLNIGAIVLFLGLIGWILYRVFGSQVFGVPAMVGVLVIIAGWTVLGNVGVRGLLAVVIALLVLMLVIGMAMRIGPEPPPSGTEQEKPVEDLWPQ
ncbi:MAG TPA: hypothetical protein VKG82_08355 [Solirubrobacteraceae bacterium]|nr:hypothetical protein [Solirubrobacteraceae bacterium]